MLGKFFIDRKIWKLLQIFRSSVLFRRSFHVLLTWHNKALDYLRYLSFPYLIFSYVILLMIFCFVCIDKINLASGFVTTGLRTDVKIGFSSVRYKSRDQLTDIISCHILPDSYHLTMSRSFWYAKERAHEELILRW